MEIYNARNHINGENFKLKLCTCGQSDALGTRTKFQLEILKRRMISAIHKFRENTLESLQNIVKHLPGFFEDFCCWPPDKISNWGVVCTFCYGLVLVASRVVIIPSTTKLKGGGVNGIRLSVCRHRLVTALPGAVLLRSVKFGRDMPGCKVSSKFVHGRCDSLNECLMS